MPGASIALAEHATPGGDWEWATWVAHHPELEEDLTALHALYLKYASDEERLGVLYYGSGALEETYLRLWQAIPGLLDLGLFADCRGVLDERERERSALDGALRAAIKSGTWGNAVSSLQIAVYFHSASEGIPRTWKQAEENWERRRNGGPHHPRILAADRKARAAVAAVSTAPRMGRANRRGPTVTHFPAHIALYRAWRHWHAANPEGTVYQFAVDVLATTAADYVPGPIGAEDAALLGAAWLALYTNDARSVRRHFDRAWRYLRPDYLRSRFGSGIMVMYVRDHALAKAAG